MKEADRIRVPMREQPVKDRVKNFDSVPLGYSEEEAMAEARRCIQCKDRPCMMRCPVNMKISAMIETIAEGNFKEAYLIAKEDNPIPAISGRVCPQESQCEAVCTMGKKADAINIGKLEAFIGDWAMRNGVTEELHIDEKDKKVAVIGSGPAGISCAVDLRKLGYQVTMFEALHVAGGVLQYGIPAFRLPKDIVDCELSYLLKIGVDVRLNHIVGQNVMLDELRREFDAIFVGTGAGAPRFLNIEGEELMGIYSANEFLIRVNLMKAYDFPEHDTPIVCGARVGVMGAGNVAMDVARCAVRLGAEEVYILYRRTKRESPAREEELRHALEEGVVFVELVNPTRLLGGDDGWVKGIELARMKLGEPDSSGRPRPVMIEGSEFIMELDTVVNALGTVPNRLFLGRTPELETTGWGAIKVDENLMTNIEGVFAGGDSTSGGATVIQALGEGRAAAASIHNYLSGR
ncbi:MAG: NADPH-dependent glutamate synthase [Euryarchaeota archaeon]|uniref:NADPH-dependent glutamate synthase beta chain and related oxidoreductase n=1 Tax=Methanothrix harundinacea TaxID=301375 RepID=A0A101IIF9_9EURY|nr:MAG: dihydropyrimidine dehydrogenase [Methanosaeta sp. SDB]KUK44625.1 MAG: NADPH-dependent glutamate synthase beta chain and related oxidoreductase [Methanothrix harundinacea]KUK95834.1 MAG: NADPH-dependent glutamate synthase beta chain and related oxidoreductase [Methanothrix harundinacea]MDD3709174.1 NADPH-dependent glutamate synthase [Methanothrix sp.]MDI9400014.1 NADPH-dependent glutamate synthase [Euryarchaeota archaeon]